MEKALKEDVHLVILDVSMPRMTGIQAAVELHKRKPELKLIMLSMHDSEQFLFEALKAGASGFVLRSGADTNIIEACRAALLAIRSSIPRRSPRSFRDYVERGAEDKHFDVLTPRELEVLKLNRRGFQLEGDRERADAICDPPRPHSALGSAG